MMNSPLTPRLIGLGLGAALLTASLATPGSALAAPKTLSIPAGTLVDPSFEAADAVLVDGETSGRSTIMGCVDRNFTALALIWKNSVNGCSVIGTKPGVTVGYAWRTDGGGSALINARGYDKNRKTSWYAMPGSGGRTMQIPWGNVAAAKMIQGISLTSAATKIKFS